MKMNGSPVTLFDTDIDDDVLVEDDIDVVALEVAVGEGVFDADDVGEITCEGVGDLLCWHSVCPS